MISGKYSALLFDLDGTLINSVDLIIACFKKSLHHAAGLHLSDADIRAHIGLPLKKQFEAHLAHKLGADYDYTDLMKYHMDYQISIWKDMLHLYAGVTEMLEELVNKKYALAIVTSRRRETAHLYTEGLGIQKYFSVIITPEDTLKHKPDAEPVLLGMTKLSALPARSLYIGDSIFDIQAGTAAGIDTCFTEWGALESLPADMGASYQIKHPSELLKIVS
jgi:pyrophosphatase PpaX